jgi:uncharacterized damage-inducible protein DinB
MSIAQTLLPEFDQEMANTRRVLERVPFEQFSYKPHAKSFEFGKLATHVANLPTWAVMTLTTDGLDLSQAGHVSVPRSTEELLAFFDHNIAEARQTIAGASDETFHQPWTLRNGEHVIFTLPKVAVYRSAVMNHIIHHRAQLTVYMRLNDIPVPGLYGPSADEM